MSNARIRRPLTVVAACLLTFGAVAAELPGSPVPTPFSLLPEGAPGGGWQPVELRGKTASDFTVVSGPQGNVLQITSDAAASALAYAVEVAAEETALLSWRWKIEGHVAGSDIRTKSGDDFPARVYVTFARDPDELPFATRMKIRLAKMLYGQDVPAAALCYVWAESLPQDLMVPNAYSDTVMMVVARSGGAVPSGWHDEQRDLQADYRAAFGADAPAVTSVMVAADTDDTGTAVRAWFGDIRLHPAE